MFSQKFDTLGNPVGSEIQVNSTTASYQTAPEISALEGGGYVGVWKSNIGGGTETNLIVGQIFGADNVKVGGEIELYSNQSDTSAYPDVIGMKDGGFLALFQTPDFGPDNLTISAHRYDASGNPIGEYFTIADINGGGVANATVTVLANGGYVVTWNNDEYDGADDEIFVQQFAPQLFGTAGNDTVIDNVGANWIDGQAGDDVLKGKSGNDTIRGGEGADQLYGQQARDILLGGSGADTLYGGGQSDELFGGSGNDRLIGGNGRDYLKGGAGADVFVYTTEKHSGPSRGADHILDFQIGVDKLDLTAFDLGFTFVNDREFTEGGPEIGIGVNGSGHTVVRVDLDGDGTFDMKIVPDNTSGLTSGDFLI